MEARRRSIDSAKASELAPLPHRAFRWVREQLHAALLRRNTQELRDGASSKEGIKPRPGLHKVSGLYVVVTRRGDIYFERIAP